MITQVRQETKHVEIPQTHTSTACRGACGDASTGPSVQTVPKTVAVSPAQPVRRVVDVPVTTQVRQEAKHVEIPQTQYIEEGVEVPALMQRQVHQVQGVSKKTPSVSQQRRARQKSEILAEALCRRATSQLC